jgi:hypothetical protein
MNGNTTQNVALAAMAAAIVTPFAEKHWGLKVSPDDMVDVLAGIAFALHALNQTLGPYAKRVFDHFFPEPAVPVVTKEIEK